MDLSLLQVSYMVLAPLSTFSGICFLGIFVRVPRLRKPPNGLLIWQIVAQTVFDIHWFSAFFQHGYENIQRCLGTMHRYRRYRCLHLLPRLHVFSEYELGDTPMSAKPHTGRRAANMDLETPPYAPRCLPSPSDRHPRREGNGQLHYEDLLRTVPVLGRVLPTQSPLTPAPGRVHSLDGRGGFLCLLQIHVQSKV